jgi:hypothetical protein
LSKKEKLSSFQHLTDRDWPRERHVRVELPVAYEGISNGSTYFRRLK